MPARSREKGSEHAALRTNVRTSASSFVGRIAERRGIARLFEKGARLVTLMGLGGLGKTRIALRFAENEVARYSTPGAGGVWFCDLTDVRDPARAAEVVASELGITLPARETEGEVMRELGRSLSARKSILVVLDNFEQLSAAAEATVGVWMREAPRARFLVTSRVALCVDGEHRWPLRPMALPPSGGSDPSKLRQVEAVDLFLKRASQIDPDLEIDDRTLETVSAIVRRLEGVPLAIELAVARLSVLSVAQLAGRLSATTHSSMPEGEGRHGSMRRAIADSYVALGDDAQRGLSGCSIFVGGFTLDAAESVLGSPGRPFLQSLETLRTHSLVRVHPTREPGSEPRFSLYETIREFAEERLEAEAGRRGALQLAHARHYAAAASGAVAEARFALGGEASTRLGQDLDNLLVAHAFALSHPSLEAARWAVTLAVSLDPVLEARGMSRARFEVFDGTLSKAEAIGSGAEESWSALWLGRARASRDLGQFKHAREDYERALGAARAAGHMAFQARAHIGLGELLERDGSTVEARAHFASSRALAMTLPDGSAVSLLRADAAASMAHALRREGSIDEAEAEITTAIETYRFEARDETLAASLYEAAVIALFRSRPEEARQRFDEALERACLSGARHVEGIVRSGLGILLQEQKSLDEAFEQHTTAVEIARASGTPYREGSALYYLGGTYLEKGQLSDARSVLERASGLVRAVGAPRYTALIEACLAVLAASEGRDEIATRCLAIADEAALLCRTESSLLAAVSIHRLHVTALLDGSARAMDGRLDEARRRASQHANDDPRFAIRCFEASAARRIVETFAPPLVIHRMGSGFRVPGAESNVDLARRKPLARIMHVLARRRVESPGEGLALEDLLAAGWPGEKVARDAASNRVYVAVTTLRKLGLRPLLKSSASGYLLDPSVPCVLDEG